MFKLLLQLIVQISGNISNFKHIFAEIKFGSSSMPVTTSSHYSYLKYEVESMEVSREFFYFYQSCPVLHGAAYCPLA